MHSGRGSVDQEHLGFDGSQFRLKSDVDQVQQASSPGSLRQHQAGLEYPEGHREFGRDTGLRIGHHSGVWVDSTGQVHGDRLAVAHPGESIRRGAQGPGSAYANNAVEYCIRRPNGVDRRGNSDLIDDPKQPATSGEQGCCALRVNRITQRHCSHSGTTPGKESRSMQRITAVVASPRQHHHASPRQPRPAGLEPTHGGHS
jgi:hypothetical protein